MRLTVSCRIARAATLDGDAAHTDFTVVASNPDADLGHFTPGIVATEQMYQLRSAHVLTKPCDLQHNIRNPT